MTIWSRVRHVTSAEPYNFCMERGGELCETKKLGGRNSEGETGTGRQCSRHVQVNVYFFNWSSKSGDIRTSVPVTKQFKRLVMGTLTSQLTNLGQAEGADIPVVGTTFIFHSDRIGRHLP